MKSYSNSDYCITELSKTAPAIAGNAICPPCSQRDVRANGAPVAESNPYAVSEYYLDVVHDPVGLASRCNGGVGIPETSPPAGTGTASSSGTSPLDTFRLHIETEIPPAAVPANKGLHPYVDPLNSGSGFGYHPVEASPEQPLLDFDFSYFDSQNRTSG